MVAMIDTHHGRVARGTHVSCVERQGGRSALWAIARHTIGNKGPLKRAKKKQSPLIAGVLFVAIT